MIIKDHEWEIFYSMTSTHNINPRAMHYACMIEILGREGLLNEALALIKDAPFEPTMNMWAALLTACRVHKNLELGRFAAEKLYGMGPEKLSNYVVLLNIYNSAGKFEEAGSVIRTLKQKGLRMLPACTWIDIKKASYAFHSGNRSHNMTEEMYQRLDSLLVKISKHGYIPERRHLLPDVDDKEERMLLHHSEKLAVAFGLMNTPDYMPLQLVQSHRICNDCHNNKPEIQWLVKWLHKPVEEATWEKAVTIEERYPLFDPWGQGSSEERRIDTNTSKDDADMEDNQGEQGIELGALQGTEVVKKKYYAELEGELDI